MFRYLLKRLFYSLIVLWGVSLVIFSILRIMPDDPARTLLPPQASEETVEAYRIELGLEDPLWDQYIVFIQNILTGEWGQSVLRGDSVMSLILERFGATVELAIVSLIIGIAISIPAGVLSALYRDTIIDYLATFGSLFGVSMPNFWFGILLVLIVSVQLGLLPVFGYPSDTTGLDALISLVHGNISPLITFLSYIILPAIALGTYMTAILTRTTRANMLNEIGMDYVKTARAKGISEYRVAVTHLLRNAILPTITLFGLEMAKLLGGAVVIEVVFAWPGLGRLIINSIEARDFPVVQGGIVFIAVFFTLVNIGVDIFYTYLDPRIEY